MVRFIFDLTGNETTQVLQLWVMLKYTKKYNTIKISEKRDERKNENYEILKKVGLQDKIKGLL